MEWLRNIKNIEIYNRINSYKNQVKNIKGEKEKIDVSKNCRSS
jgi:hypothetical protein